MTKGSRVFVRSTYTRPDGGPGLPVGTLLVVLSVTEDGHMAKVKRLLEWELIDLVPTRFLAVDRRAVQ